MTAASNTMACVNHDIEAVYGAYNYYHDVADPLYAMDKETLDVAVVGGITR